MKLPFKIISAKRYNKLLKRDTMLFAGAMETVKAIGKLSKTQRSSSGYIYKRVLSNFGYDLILRKQGVMLKRKGE